MKKLLFLLIIFMLLINVASAANNTTAPSASVELHGEKTDVVLGEDIVLKLSAVNIITKPMMTVQVILIPFRYVRDLIGFRYFRRRAVHFNL